MKKYKHRVTLTDITMWFDENNGSAGKTWRSDFSLVELENLEGKEITLPTKKHKRELTLEDIIEFDKLYREGIQIAAEMQKDIQKNRARVQQEKLVLGSNPPPKSGKARPSWELVIQDMKARDKTGFKKYGVRLQADNGRNHLQDAYEEALDLAVYLRTQIEKEKLDGK